MAESWRRKQRRIAIEWKGIAYSGSLAPVLGHGDTITPSHEERLDTVAKLIIDSGATTVLDLGCGTGSLLKRLSRERRLVKLVGIDQSLEALRLADQALRSECDADTSRFSLICGPLDSSQQCLMGFDAAAMVETIEHIAPTQISKVEQTVFGVWRPAMVVITTPNQEYNRFLGLASSERRHSDHHFEWTRSKFQSWASGVADRRGYRVAFDDLGPTEPAFGGPSQMGVFYSKFREGFVLEKQS